jgi:alpha-ketoglutarate-dependent taurine dioxygenase
MPHPDDCLLLCEGIKRVRAEDYPGKLEDEVALYKTLLTLCRSPELLLRVGERRSRLAGRWRSV